MRKTMLGLAAAVAASLSAAPAMACGGFGGCAQPVYSPCSPCGDASAFHRLPAAEPQFYAAAPRYYHVDQGPTFSGPGMLAPAPVYQERAVSGSGVYNQPYGYGYTGGPYADPTDHSYYGMPYSRGPAVYSYRARPSYYGVRRVQRYGWAPRVHRVHRAYRVERGYAPYYRPAMRPSMRYGYAPRRAYVPRYGHAPRYGYAPRHAYAPRFAPASRYGHAPRMMPASRYGYGPRPMMAPAPRFAPPMRHGGPQAGFAPRMHPQGAPMPHSRPQMQPRQGGPVHPQMPPR